MADHRLGSDRRRNGRGRSGGRRAGRSRSPAPVGATHGSTPSRRRDRGAPELRPFVPADAPAAGRRAWPHRYRGCVRAGFGGRSVSASDDRRHPMVYVTWPRSRLHRASQPAAIGGTFGPVRGATVLPPRGSTRRGRWRHSIAALPRRAGATPSRSSPGRVLVLPPRSRCEQPGGMDLAAATCRVGGLCLPTRRR
jgi:hypothetical protein